MTAKNHDVLEQFNALIDSKLPDEYKDILKSFQQQGLFYQQLFQNMNHDESDLSEFWDLPSTLGYTTVEQDSWLKSIFDMSHLKNGANSSATDLFSQLANNIPPQIKDSAHSIQENMTTMAAFNNELNHNATRLFQELRNESDDSSNEQLCAHWLKAGEKAFEEISQREDYIQTQNELFETLATFKNNQATLIEQLSDTLGIPSAQSLKDVQKSLHQLRLEFAEYKEHANAKIITLEKTLRKLQTKTR